MGYDNHDNDRDIMIMMVKMNSNSNNNKYTDNNNDSSSSVHTKNVVGDGWLPGWQVTDNDHWATDRALITLLGNNDDSGGELGNSPLRRSKGEMMMMNNDNSDDSSDNADSNDDNEDENDSDDVLSKVMWCGHLFEDSLASTLQTKN